jgi:signal peptidase II
MPRRLPPVGFYGIALALAALDQLTKALVRTKLPLGQLDSVPIVPGFFQLMHTRNEGMAFSYLWGQRWLLVLAAVVIGGLIVGTERRATKGGGLERLYGVGLAMALAGALGNLTDRVRDGFVTDFLDFYYGQHHFPTFNVADSCITIGIGLLALRTLTTKEPQKSPAPETAA